MGTRDPVAGEVEAREVTTSRVFTRTVRCALVGVCALLLMTRTAAGQTDWRFYEETNIVGSISGTIRTGHIFRTTSGNLYEIAEPYLSLELELAPRVVVVTDGTLFRLIIEGFDDPILCRMLNSGPMETGVAGPTLDVQRALVMLGVDLVADGLRGAETEEALTRFQADQQLPQTGRADPATLQALADALQAHEAVTLQKIELALSVLRAASAALYTRYDSTVAEVPLAGVSLTTPDVIESRLDGDFEGYDYGNIYRLTNGQIWEQVSARYRYRYRFMPDVLIVKRDGVYQMRIEPLEDWVTVRRLR